MSSPSISALTLGSSLSAAMHALTKKPMKPRRTPCFFSKLSLYSLRRAMTWLISTSLKVVSWAAVFCDSLSRSAIVRRRRDMATRSSRFALGRGPAGTTGAGAGFTSRRASSAASMSPLVTRPSLPVPVTSAGSRLFSSPMRRADGIGCTSAFGAGAGAAAGFGAGLGAAESGLLAATDDGAPALPSARRPSTAPTCTVSPALTAMDSIAPDAGAGTSTVTLSVSSSSSGSSRTTASPSFLNQRATVASVTDSPIAGTLISIMVVPIFRLLETLDPPGVVGHSENSFVASTQSLDARFRDLGSVHFKAIYVIPQRIQRSIGTRELYPHRAIVTERIPGCADWDRSAAKKRDDRHRSLPISPFISRERN